jgi:peptidoglycan hydrolase-like protein with peptidoglycan-binding domain
MSISLIYRRVIGIVLAGVLCLYPLSVDAASCNVLPFSQTITAGQSVSYRVLKSGGGGQVTLGNLPQGVSGSFGEQGTIAKTDNFPLNITTNRNSQVGSFSLVLVADSKPLCQYVLQIQAPPPLELGFKAPEKLVIEPVKPEAVEQPAEPSVIILPFGSVGPQVRELQRLLAQDPSIYPEGLVTGWYGPLTITAVQRFQLREGIPPAGIVDTATQEKLDELRGVKQTYNLTFTVYLSPDVQGEPIVRLQNALKQLGFFPEYVDSNGFFGPVTEAAVKQYQISKGIEPTGTVGPITRNALNQE